MYKQTPIALACSLALTATGAAFAQTPPAQPAADQAAAPAGPVEPKTLEAIMVTASKRTERLQDTPIAITALSSEALDRLGVEQFDDYVSLVP
ncbi:MAG: TonB-dependent receptor, partial [Burkholderiales bacterium]